MKSLLMFVLCLPLAAQETPASSKTLDRWLLGSKTAYATSMGLDSLSSWNRYELNPILQDASGKFNGKGLAIKASITTGVLIGEWWVLTKWPSLKKAATIGNFVLAGVMTGAAVRNYRMEHP